MSAARKALRGASERHAEGVPRWRGRSHLSVSVKTQKHTLAFRIPEAVKALCVRQQEPPPSAPQEVNSQTAATLHPPRLLSRPSGRPQPLPSILTTHTELRPPVTQFRVRKDRTSVWVLTWMRIQSSGENSNLEQRMLLGP
ncbi:unnamed protein product [Pleuronectes platessa]|uniref:Uncharacterized protein n=1 Tax=Pleuronectes platessa TaxID=8262 RepID=A0A9N7U3U7_PLEPL|nr:unnamed protein product [Pleuronectes platessa]